MQLTTAACYCQLIMKEQKAVKDFKGIDLLARQSERYARIGKFSNGTCLYFLGTNARTAKGQRRRLLPLATRSRYWTAANCWTTWSVLSMIAGMNCLSALMCWCARSAPPCITAHPSA